MLSHSRRKRKKTNKRCNITHMLAITFRFDKERKKMPKYLKQKRAT